MQLLDGTASGFAMAVDMIVADPHPAHIDDALSFPGLRALIGESVRVSRMGGYALGDGTAMIIAAAPTGKLRYQGWMMTTSSVDRRPKWMLREALRIQELADEIMDSGSVSWQEIPGERNRLIAFLMRLGFNIADLHVDHLTGKRSVIMERKVLADVLS